MRSSPLATWKNSNLFCLVFLSLISLNIQAQELRQESNSSSTFQDLGLTGSFRPSYWNRNKSFSDDRNFLVASAWLKLSPPDFEGFKLVADAFVQGQDLGRNNKAQSELRELFVEKSLGPIDIKFGRQIVVWGRADKANPTDSFSTKDLTLLMTDDEDQRLGSTLTQIIYNFSNWRLISIWQSEWRTPITPAPSSAALTLNPLRPGNAQNQFGIKADVSGGEWDWSLSYFDGFNRSPDLIIKSTSPTLALDLDYSPIKVYGADFAKTIGDIGLRGEIAYTKTIDSKGDDPFKQNSLLYAVLGAEKNLFENFNLNAQLLYRQIQDFQDPDQIADPGQRAIAQNLAKFSNQKYQQQAGMSLRPSYKAYNDTLELEIAFVSWQKNGDSLIRPKVTYSINDRLKAIAGAEFYNGSSDTLLGQLKDTSSGFAELRLFF